MWKKLGAATSLLSLVFFFSGCTTNVYHVLKAENNYYIVPVNNLPQDSDEEVPDGAVTILTKSGTNYLVLPKAPKTSPKSSRAL